MPLQKQPININFAGGLDTKTDPFQLPVGKFLSLENTVFEKGGLLQKRNGFGPLASLPDTTSTYATTFNGNLTAIGSNLRAYSSGSETWVTKGALQPLELSTLSIIRSNTNQSYADSVTSNNLVCTVYTDQNPASLGSSVYKYVIADSVTGQNIVAPTAIPVASGAVTGSPRVFILGRYFVIVFTNVITAVNHLQYVAISITNPTIVTTNTNITSAYTPSSHVAWDGVVANNNLYIAWNANDGGGAIRMTYIDQTLLQHGVVAFATNLCTMMSVTADMTGVTPVIYAAFYDGGGSTGYILAVNQQLSTVLAPTEWIATGTILNVTCAAQNGVATIYYEVSNNYSYDSSIPSHLVKSRTCTQAGVLGSAAVVSRSVGLASKAFIVGTTEYFLAVYFSTYQPTYFLMTSSGQVVAKLAYSNGGGYYVTGLPGAQVVSNAVTIPYLFKDLIQAVNKNTNVPSGSQVNGIYSQTGINLATFTIGTSNIVVSEIGQNLHLTGGFLWMYDGYIPVEHNFFVWPDSIEVTSSTSGGLLTAQDYYYQVTYEWSDNQGNIHRSAPSIPVKQTTTGATSSNTINVPMLRLTYKTANPVKIVIYRWSTAQQTYYQVTSLTSPVLNDPTADSVAFVDTLADSTILGNNIIYTNGGVVENIAAPACSSVTLFDDRLFLLDSEDGTVWYSKQVIPTVPVEMSDLFTIYVAPTIGSSGSTGNVKCMFPMDDKLILFKQEAIYYLNGSGPDNTGANGQYSQPIFITSTVGSINQQSIVFTPMGLLFQSDKGIWLLGRNLQTTYVGAPVEAFNTANVLSAVNIPGTNQVRFTLDSGVTLMFDYYYEQWGTFTGAPAISSTLYQGLHTFINSYGAVYQETPGVYLDGSRPVLMSFTTSWLNLAGVQGYQRLYYFYLAGTYLSPHKLNVQIAYDYNSSPSQSSLITPNNYAPLYGQDPVYGLNSPYGGPGVLEQWRVFAERQRCEAFQISLSEVYDASFGVPAGAGLTLSSIDCVVGLKKGYRPVGSNISVG